MRAKCGRVVPHLSLNYELAIVISNSSETEKLDKNGLL